MDASPYRPPSSEIDSGAQKSRKSYAVSVALSGIFGILGIHHFYLGRIGHGLFDLSLSVIGFALLIAGSSWGWLFLGVDFVHTIVVFFMLMVGTYRDGDGLLVTYPGQKVKSKDSTP